MTTINKDKYKFEKYNPIYKILFQKEKAKLIKIFPKSQIEHVGSTSVPDLGGKGIIDIAISAPKNQINNSIKLLEKNGFEYKIKPLDKKRKFLQKIKSYRKKQRRIHIHLTNKNSIIWKSLIALRDYLIKNKEAREEYAKIKKRQ
ncbi:GrpB family protein [Candidatus Pacearchaeota archaeon]|nr:GrpB family protein [Candidatus Pacearchaeota archaeon]